MRANKETELIIRTTFCYDFLADVIQGLEELKPKIASGREIGNPWIHKTRVFPQVSVICKMSKACVLPCLRTLQSLHNAHKSAKKPCAHEPTVPYPYHDMQRSDLRPFAARQSPDSHRID